MRAYCYASGLILFGRTVPDGALPIACGPAKHLRDFIEVYARHGYKTRKIKGRPTKIPGTDCLLVPGMPYTRGQIAAVDALRDWLSWIKPHAPRGVTVGAAS